MVVTRDNVVEIPNWLKRLPLAPEFHPTETEFADPIAYISKIEKEASVFGICKIIPPLPKPSKKYVLDNLNKSLAKCPDFASGVSVSGSGSKAKDGDAPAVFTTRHQELGRNVKKTREGAQTHQLSAKKQVWQSGEAYTIEQFETKSKVFAKSVLSVVKDVSPLVVESMFWKADSEKSIYIEYANDVPGSCFSEPEGSHRYFLKRRRRRVFKKNCGAVSSFNNYEVEMKGGSYSNLDSVGSGDVNANVCVKKECSDSSVITADATLQVSSISDMEGTAGWNLSNSPWNLQVIARSPGSLTRYMPDDIPGVTSPMIYIGMLFSWFAWHVEDHELHSLNYMHTGSPKTWYSVPGDYAFNFEEVIRTQAYGGDIDHFAALKLLGEKTTLLSPEIIVASGIPCCRLIQHPGEFVVTFPRAYHIGFSHGFNCGEAANFGTPQWLQVAKEAAVRRAASNHLPMLSHQQLLYLLTMSFVSRLPRSLLPGARNSRLKDRQKEEREKSVKKAFLEDIVKENTLATVLLAKDSSYRSVSWNPESLPSYSKEYPLPSQIAGADTTSPEIGNSGDNDRKKSNLYDEMSLFMETVNDLYMDDEDLSCDFQVGSGSLACVACGILGFPFVSIIQPSERASTELDCAEHFLTKSQSFISSCSSNIVGNITRAVSENLSAAHDNSLSQGGVQLPSKILLHKSWNTSNGFLRPRIFCLEHAVQIERLLKSKGGANVLVICHSDYQKMKAHATTIAEEIGCSFRYKEIPLVSASQEDLNLVDLAIDDVVHDKCGEDWTSKLAINLRDCIKTRKIFAPNIQHAVTLSGLFSDMSPASSLYPKWQARKSRSQSKFNLSVCSKPCKSVKVTAEEPMPLLDGTLIRKEDKIILYSRRSTKFKSASTTTLIGSAQPTEIKSATSENLDKSGYTRSSTNCINECDAAQVENHASDEVSMDNEDSHLERIDSYEIHNEMNIYEDANDRSMSSFAESLKTVCIDIPAETWRDVLIEKMTATDNHEGQYAMQFDKEVLSNMACDHLANRTSSAVSDLVLETSDDQVETSNNEILDHVMINNIVFLETKTTPEITVDPVSRDIVPSNECSDLIMEGKMLQEIQTTSRHPADSSASGNNTRIHQPSFVPTFEISDNVKEACGARNMCSGRSSDEKRSQENETAEANKGKEVDSTVTVTNQLSSVTTDERFESSQQIRAVEKCCDGLSSNVTAREIQMPNKNSEDFMVERSPTVFTDNRTAFDLANCADSGSKMLPAVTVEESFKVEKNSLTGTKILCEDNSERGNMESSISKKERKRKREEDKCNYDGFFRSPCEGLRVRKPKDATITNVTDKKAVSKEVKNTFMSKKESVNTLSVSKEVKKTSKKETVKTKEPHRCHLNGCRMKFDTKAELVSHKNNHDDDRPLKCSWKGCKMSFRWSWARTEHLRVHTGERPYQCKIEDCGLSFRFISDFSRHRRKTGHYVNN